MNVYTNYFGTLEAQLAIIRKALFPNGLDLMDEVAKALDKVFEDYEVDQPDKNAMCLLLAEYALFQIRKAGEHIED